MYMNLNKNKNTALSCIFWYTFTLMFISSAKEVVFFAVIACTCAILAVCKHDWLKSFD